MTQVSFAEYHSKRNPVELVHASEERDLAKHGPFARVREESNTAEHKQAMEEMAGQVREVFIHAKFGGGGEPILCMRGQIGRENAQFPGAHRTTKAGMPTSVQDETKCPQH